MSLEKQPLTLTINGNKIGPVDVPLDMPMIDFLHEHLNLTGTRFGCGQGICHACTIVENHPDGSTTESRTCVFSAHYFNNKSI
ncbi:2Fe-2S iron-sulfur cluster-binding protein, partial [Paenalcaligenes suwonensis]|nr:(2Fe-2S)-binding protein [Paenalcaligenes suwonensis]NHC62406.1 (2Fe-2S)-binding protein [Paenalcaligenes suwonensis]